MRTRDTDKEALVREKAIEIVVKEGLDGFSMQKLAKAAGISPATLYIYYKDKEDLLTKLCIDISNQMMAMSLEGFDPHMPFAVGMRIQWRNRLAFHRQHPVEMQFMEQARYSPLYDKVRESITLKFSAVLGPFVHKAIANGELQPLPFEVYWAIAFAPLYQLIKFESQGGHNNRDFKLTDELLELTVGLVLKGLKG
jgi:AcrR family transcriptional regulator